MDVGAPGNRVAMMFVSIASGSSKASTQSSEVSAAERVLGSRSGPASIRRTSLSGYSLRRAATRQPAVPAPTTMYLIAPTVTVVANYFSNVPASTGNMIPVIVLAASDARKATALLMSRGSTHGRGKLFCCQNKGSTSARVGLS